jgi:hydrogenase-1 operon protein HyaE
VSALPLHPLLARLSAGFGFRTLDAADFDTLGAGSGHVLLVFTEDPERYRETLDLAVIVPELTREFSGRFAVVVLLPEAARAIAPRYGFRRWPAVVLLRNGDYVGAIDGGGTGPNIASSLRDCSKRRRLDLRRSASPLKPRDNLTNLLATRNPHESVRHPDSRRRSRLAARRRCRAAVHGYAEGDSSV